VRVTNPLAGEPLASRADLRAAVHSLWTPVRERLSPGRARARLGATAARFPAAAAELEGFARPLWGLVPLSAGGGEVDWDPVREGLASGSDPDHPEYWGRAGDRDQRLVEMAPIGLALALVPEQVWDPLPARDRDHLATWLSRINHAAVPDNNWLFFRVLVNEGLGRVGAAGRDADATEHALRRLESFYLGDGWYTDGPFPRRDYYVAFALHYYGLIYAALAGDRDPERAQRFRERAATFAADFACWFAADGAALPFGRSLTYRFAQGAFWGALAYAGVEALPWGTVKGLLLRNLRWWAGQPIADNGGVLTIGYAYPNLHMSEAYNSPGSPYWALKAFLPLALGQEHPFWLAEEAPAPTGGDLRALPHAGMLVHSDRGEVTALAGGQAGPFRHGAEKYAKFAYSTRFGFSVPTTRTGLAGAGHDSMLALSDDGLHWRVRAECAAAALDGEVLWSRWQPFADVEVETWLLFHGSWQVRVHRVRAGRALHSAEGGWALNLGAEARQDSPEHAAGYAAVASRAGHSGIRDLAGGRAGEVRAGEVVAMAPNSNLLHPRTALPTLRGQHRPGRHWLLCAVLGAGREPDWAGPWRAPPTLEQLRDLVPGLAGRDA
jgi:hypothetical protein